MDNHIFSSKLKSSFRKRTRFRQGTSLTCSKKMSSATLSPDDRYITIDTFKISSRPSVVSTFSNLAPRSPLPLRIFFLHSITQIYLDFSSGKLSLTLHYTLYAYILHTYSMCTVL